MSQAINGQVVVAYGAQCVVETASGELVRCGMRRRGGGRPVCGDHVHWRVTGGGGVIERIGPRHGLIERGDFRGRPRPLAANVDRMIIVVAEPPGIDNTLIDRYLVLADYLGLNAAIFVNKADALDDEARAAVARQLSIYHDLDVATITGSAHGGEGLAALTAGLAGRTSILVGHSGVGKSSLINALVPDLDLRIGALSETSGQGRHTTTATTLFHLPGGGDLIDSPGVRTLRIDHLPANAVIRGFPEISEHTGGCRFRDCAHSGEPGCAVDTALANGRITPERMASLRALLAEADRG